MAQNVGHGHVFPRPDGVKARCGGPLTCAECAADFARKQLLPDPANQPWQTGLGLHEGEPWDVLPDIRLDADDLPVYPYLAESSAHHVKVPIARLRRVGWLDQKGRVYLKVPPGAEFDGGSLTPLLIDPGERDGL